MCIWIWSPPWRIYFRISSAFILTVVVDNLYSSWCSDWSPPVEKCIHRTHDNQSWKPIVLLNTVCCKCLKCIKICFLQLPRDDEILSQKLREEARAIFLQRRGKQLLNNNELKVSMEIQCVTFYVQYRDLVLCCFHINSKQFRPRILWPSLILMYSSTLIGPRK
jgi:hypothetical protein